MQKSFFVITVGVVGSFFVFFNFVRAANNDIVINEIGASATSGHEWIEIWNKGSEPIDIGVWKFWENGTNHGLSVSTTDSIVGPGEFGVICQEAETFLLDYPSFLGSVFDSAWSSLNESGEEVGLKDEGENFVEQFTYVSAAVNSLERINPLLSVYDSTNWREHANGNTVGAINSVYSTDPIVIVTTTPETPSSTPETPTTTPETPSTTPSLLNLWGFIKINEFVSDPVDGNEWVEFYNTTSTAFDLSGGLLCDNRETTSTCKMTAGTIAGLDWLYFDLATKSFLNNDADSVVLLGANSKIVDRTDYGGSSAGEKGESLARSTDGTGAFVVTRSPTPGIANTITSRPTPVSGGGGGGSATPPKTETKIEPKTEIPVVVSTTTVASGVVINELYPNPSGSDTESEFVELKNIGEKEINLVGWKLSDITKTFGLSGIIQPGKIIFFKRTITNISLNNSSKEEVRLYTPTNVLADYVTYDKAPEGESHNRFEEKWEWSSEPTPGEENEAVVLDETKIIWKVKAPTQGEPGEVLVFDAEDSADPRGGEVEYAWEFPDNILPGGEVEYSFVTSGLFTVKVMATSTSGTKGEEKVEVNIGGGLSLNNSSVIINEVFVNPEGTDSNEFVELFNTGTVAANLSGWRLRNTTNKTYIFPDNTLIAPQSYLVFYRLVTKLSLDNKGDRVELLTPNNESADLVKFGESNPGQSYGVVGGEWRLISTPTPGKANLAQVLGEKITAPVAATKSSGGAKGVSYNNFTLAMAREVPKNDGVKVRGIVSVLPGVFGGQYFYITDGSAGIQVYQYKKLFPVLSVGDAVEIKGVISEASGQKRVKLSGVKDVDVLSVENNVSSTEHSLDELNEDVLGSVVKVVGDITEIKTNSMYIDDGQSEAIVYFKRGANINKKDFAEGDKVEVVGVLETTETGLQIWPRNQADIKVIGQAEEMKNKNNTSTEKVPNNYLPALGGGVAGMLVGFIIKGQGKKKFDGGNRKE